MKKIFLIILALIAFKVYATEDIIYDKNYKNVHFQSGGISAPSETLNKLDIFIDLLEKLVDSKKYSLPVFIQVSDEFYPSNKDSNTYSVSYGRFSYKMRDKKCKTCENGYDDKDYQDIGLIVSIRDRSYKIKEWLQFINSVFQNAEYIKLHQQLNAKSFSLKEDATIDSIIRIKEYCRYVGGQWKEVYYYQNSKFYFQYFPFPMSSYLYDSLDKNNHHFTNDYPNRFIPPKGMYSRDYALVTDNVLAIGSSRYGDFVYINDSTFYFMPEAKTKPIGPYVLNNISRYRVIYAQYTCYEYPLKYVMIQIESRLNKTGFEKILYSPDSNLLVQDYDSVEDKSILRLFKKKYPATGGTSISKQIVLSLSCLLTGLLIGFLVFKRPKVS